MANNAYPCCKCGGCDLCVSLKTVPAHVDLAWLGWLDKYQSGIETVCAGPTETKLITPSSELNTSIRCYLARTLSAKAPGCCVSYYGEMGFGDYFWNNVSGCPSTPEYSLESNWSRGNTLGFLITVTDYFTDYSALQVNTVTVNPTLLTLSGPCVPVETAEVVTALYVEKDFFCAGAPTGNLITDYIGTLNAKNVYCYTNAGLVTQRSVFNRTTIVSDVEPSSCILTPASTRVTL